MTHPASNTLPASKYVFVTYDASFDRGSYHYPQIDPNVLDALKAEKEQGAKIVVLTDEVEEIEAIRCLSNIRRIAPGLAEEIVGYHTTPYSKENPDFWANIGKEFFKTREEATSGLAKIAFVGGDEQALKDAATKGIKMAYELS